MKHKKLVGLLAIPIIAGGVGIGAYTANQAHAVAVSPQSAEQSADKPEPGDTPDKPTEADTPDKAGEVDHQDKGDKADKPDKPGRSDGETKD